MAKQIKSADSKPAKAPKVAKCHQLTPQEKEQLFNLYIVPNFSSIKSLTRRYTDRPWDVDDNYNYCLAQLYNYIGSYNPSQKLDTWIHICVKRACFHENKKRAEEASHMTDMEMCTPDDIYQRGTSMVVQAGFGTLMDNISDEMRSALLQIPAYRLSPFMLHAQGYGIREITAFEWKAGHLEKKNEDLVKSRIYWARRQLKYILKQNGVTRENF